MINRQHAVLLLGDQEADLGPLYISLLTVPRRPTASKPLSSSQTLYPLNLKCGPTLEFTQTVPGHESTAVSRALWHQDRTKTLSIHDSTSLHLSFLIYTMGHYQPQLAGLLC